MKKKIVKVVNSVIKKKKDNKVLDKQSIIKAVINSQENESNFTETKASINDDKILKPQIFSNQGFEEFERRFKSGGVDMAPLDDSDYQLASPLLHVNPVELQEAAPFNWEHTKSDNPNNNVDIDNCKIRATSVIERGKNKSVQGVDRDRKTSLSLKVENNDLFQDNFQRVESFDWDKHSGSNVGSQFKVENHLPTSAKKDYYAPSQIIKNVQEDTRPLSEYNDIYCAGDSSSCSDHSY